MLDTPGLDSVSSSKTLGSPHLYFYLPPSLPPSSPAFFTVRLCSGFWEREEGKLVLAFVEEERGKEVYRLHCREGRRGERTGAGAGAGKGAPSATYYRWESSHFTSAPLPPCFAAVASAAAAVNRAVRPVAPSFGTGQPNHMTSLKAKLWLLGCCNTSSCFRLVAQLYYT